MSEIIEAIVAEYFPAPDARLINRRVFTEPEFRSALTRAAEGRWVKPGVCLKLCSAHQGMTYSFTVMSAPPVPEVCPICHPEALPTPPTD